MFALPHVINENLTVASRLKAKIETKDAVVAVLGLGYVGLPLAVEKAKVGFKVIGFEKSSGRAEAVNKAINFIKDVKDQDLQEVVNRKALLATTDFNRLNEADVIVICVPTPLTNNREPDISFIELAADEISSRLRPGQLVTLESTTYPGTTEDIILPRLKKTGLKVGEDFFLAYSPERVDPGNKRFTTQNTSKVVGGVTSVCLEVAYTFYDQTIKHVVPVSSPAVAEMTKVFENTYRSVNIALVNELMLLCDKMGLDIWEVVEAAGTKPFGIQTFYPGPGVGGHCIPIDPFYLTWKAREYDFHTRFIELAGEINIEVSYYVVDKVIEALNKKRKALNGSSIFVLGVAYKKNISDLREGPALRIIPQLINKGAKIMFHDPYVQEILPQESPLFFGSSSSLSKELLNSSDCVLILTDHDNIDYQFVADESPIIVDTRNALKNVKVDKDKVIKI